MVGVNIIITCTYVFIYIIIGKKLLLHARMYLYILLLVRIVHDFLSFSFCFVENIINYIDWCIECIKCMMPICCVNNGLFFFSSELLL